MDKKEVKTKVTKGLAVVTIVVNVAYIVTDTIWPDEDGQEESGTASESRTDHAGSTHPDLSWKEASNKESHYYESSSDDALRLFYRFCGDSPVTIDTLAEGVLYRSFKTDTRDSLRLFYFHAGYGGSVMAEIELSAIEIRQNNIVFHKGKKHHTIPENNTIP